VRLKDAAVIAGIVLLMFLASCAAPHFARRLPDPNTDDKTHFINMYNKALADSKPIMMIFNVRSAT
jgi:hypothetical protein